MKIISPSNIFQSMLLLKRYRQKSQSFLTCYTGINRLDPRLFIPELPDDLTFYSISHKSEQYCRNIQRKNGFQKHQHNLYIQMFITKSFR